MSGAFCLIYFQILIIMSGIWTTQTTLLFWTMKLSIQKVEVGKQICFDFLLWHKLIKDEQEIIISVLILVTQQSIFTRDNHFVSSYLSLLCTFFCDASSGNYFPLLYIKFICCIPELFGIILDSSFLILHHFYFLFDFVWRLQGELSSPKEVSPHWRSWWWCHYSMAVQVSVDHCPCILLFLKFSKDFAYISQYPTASQEIKRQQLDTY